MFVVMNRITVAEGRESDFEKTFTERDRAVDQMPGFVDMQVLRPVEGRTYIVLTRWKSVRCPTTLLTVCRGPSGNDLYNRSLTVAAPMHFQSRDREKV